MNLVIRVLGIALVIAGVAFPVLLQVVGTGKTNKPRSGSVIIIAFLAVFAGLALILEDRITEFTVRGVGTIHAVTDQAITDAKSVADLKNRVENQSATVDLVASQAARAKELSELVATQTKQAGQELETLNAAIKEADGALRKLNEDEEFQTLVLAAQNDDRESFDKLKVIANDNDNRFNVLAKQAWLTIFEARSTPISEAFAIPWAPGFDPSKLSFQVLSKLYKTTVYTLKPELLQYILGRSDIPVIQRLDFMMDVMKTDTSLKAVEYAGRYFTAGTGQKIKPMALDYLSQWWHEHRQEFVDK